MSTPKNQIQKSSLSLEGWKTLDESIALRARAALEKFSPKQLANLYAFNEVVLEKQTLDIKKLTSQNAELLKLVGILIKEMPAVTQAEVNEVDGLMSLEESLEKVRQLGHTQAAYLNHHRGKLAAEANHNKPGGSRELQAKIRAIWATGKFQSKDLCAEQECAGLGMSYSSARRALRNLPKPT